MAYVKLAVRRLWTVLLPFHPRTNGRVALKVACLTYWLAVIPLGFAGALGHVAGPQRAPQLLALLVLVNLAPLVAVYFSPDLRYRVGMDLLLGGFAAMGYDRLLRARSILTI
jgi:hypothetical protein